MLECFDERKADKSRCMTSRLCDFPKFFQRMCHLVTRFVWEVVRSFFNNDLILKKRIMIDGSLRKFYAHAIVEKITSTSVT